MPKSDTSESPLLITLLLLLGLTILSAVLAHTGDGGRSTKAMIMLLASVKFYLVAFRFMELRKAHLLSENLRYV